jgi:putative transposase
LRDLPNHYTNMGLDECCIMPNHAHAIIVLTDGPGDPDEAGVGAGLRPAPTPSSPHLTVPKRHHPLSEIVRVWKSFSSRRINALRGTPGKTVWQRNYYEHVIRNETEMANVRFYIQMNPGRWASDPENTDRSSKMESQPWECYS